MTLSQQQAVIHISPRTLQSPYAKVGKRLFDLALVSVALLMFGPLMLGIALAIRLSSPGPVLFRGRRLACGGGEYDVLKFRTMVADAEFVLQDLLRSNPELRRQYEADYKLSNDPRIIPLGRILRRYSLDELPQLFNVLRGEMSLVGPRQILSSEIWKYGEHGQELVSVRPGITGLWQVSGRSRLSYAERVRLDVCYVQNLSFWLDLKILLKTPAVVLTGDGAI